MKRLVLLLTLTMLVLGLALPVLPARANVSRYDAVWDTTAGFDTGTKSSIDTATDSCLASGQGFQLNATSGFYGISQRCPTGSPSVSPSASSLLHSWDMTTKTKEGYPGFLDLSGNGLTAYPVKRCLNVTGEFGGAAYCPYGGGSNLQTTQTALAPIVGWGGTGLLPKFTFVLRFYANVTATGTGRIFQIAYDLNQPVNTNYLDIYLIDSAAGNFQVWYQFADGSSTRQLLAANITNPSTAWHTLAYRVNYTDRKVQVVFDGVPFSARTMTSALTAGINGARPLNLLGYGSGVIGFNMAVDSLSIYGTWLTDAELVKLSMPVGTYATSGFWLSDFVDVTDAYPAEIVLGFRNQTFFSYAQSLYITNATDVDKWHTLDISFASGDANITQITLPVGGSWDRGNQSYYVTVGLTGTGNGTAQVIFVALVFDDFPALAPILPSDFASTWIFLFLIIAYGALLGLAYLADEPLFVIGAGVVMFILAFQGWTITASLGVLAALVAVALLTMVTGVLETSRLRQENRA